MLKLRVPPRVPAKQGEDDLKLAALTRDDVAKRLDLSISTVRRLEGTGAARAAARGAAREAVDADQHRAHARRVRDPRRPRDRRGSVEYRNLSELGGFDVSGPITLADITARVGAGEYRVSAYCFDPWGLRWEVFVRLGEEPW